MTTGHGLILLAICIYAATCRLSDNEREPEDFMWTTIICVFVITCLML